MSLIDKQLGKYKLTEKLGSGGMAQVYKAFQSGVERFVAVKVMHSHLAESADFKQRFQREARAVGQLQHPHIVRVIDFDTEDNHYYMVMEFMQGGTLQNYLDQIKGKLPLSDAISYMRQLTDALRYAHSYGMIHRDIKPANIMFSDSSHQHALLTDFGVAHLVDEKGMTVSGMMLGTPAYMSPEMIKGDTVDYRADLYSLGIVFYEMVTGSTPHIGDTPYAVMLKQANEPLRPARELNPDLPEAINLFLDKALKKNPADRFQSAEEMLAALNGLQQDGAINLPITPRKKSAESQNKSFATASSKITGGNGPKKSLPLVGTILAIVVIGLFSFLLLNFLGKNEQNDGTISAETPTQIVAILPDEATDTPAPTSTESPTETATPVPTRTPAPTKTPKPTLSPTPISRFELNQQTAIVSAISLTTSDESSTTQLTLDLEQVKLPPLGKHYQAWLVGTTRTVNLGELTIDDRQRVRFDTVVNANIVEDFDQLRISLEEDGTVLDQITGEVVLESSMPADQLKAFRQSLVSDLPLGLGQLQLAQQHTGFALDAVAAGDMADVLRHSEHIINIIEGSSGTNFGDWDGNGQTQNPGDGVGIPVYLGELLDQLKVMGRDKMGERAIYVDIISSAYTNSLNQINLARADAISIFSADSADEIKPILEQLATTLSLVADGFDSDKNEVIDPIAGEGGLQTAYREGLQFFAASLFPQDTLSDQPFAGRFSFSDNETAKTGSYQLELRFVPLPPAGMRYRGWMTNADRTRFLDVGVLEVEENQNRVILSAKTEQQTLNLYDEIFIISESVGSLPDETSGEVIFEGKLSPAHSSAIRQLLFSDPIKKKGFLVGLTEQADLAKQHIALLAGSLDQEDIVGAHRHAEHIINIIEGSSGKHFGDSDLNGQVQNPGDGFGVLAYLQELAVQLASIPFDELKTPQQKLSYQLVQTAQSDFITLAKDGVTMALKIISADSTAEARVSSDQLSEIIDALYLGEDYDQNNVIDPLAGEIGIRTIAPLILDLSEISVEPVK